MSQVFLWDSNNNSSYYSINSSKTALSLRLTNDPGPDIPCNPSLVVTGEQDISLYAIMNDPKLLQKIDDMPQGTTAVIDYSSGSAASANIFSAIAGQDKTIIFQVNDFQWVFNGLDVDPAKCKDINLNVYTSVVESSSLGFEDETTVLEIVFPNNGELPGPATIRIYSNYLLTKYKTSGNQLFVTYYENGVPASEPAPVAIEGDNYAVFQISHNSTYVISATVPGRGNTGSGDKNSGDINSNNNNHTNSARVQNNTTVASPQTGDDSRTILFVVLLCLSASGLATCVFLLMKKHKQKN